MNTTPCGEQFAAPRQRLDHRPSQARAIQPTRPGQRWSAAERPEKKLRLAAGREDVNMRRPMIVKKDDETQISGTMNSRHAENNLSDGLFKSPSIGNATDVT
jgi:hypothetical protein